MQERAFADPKLEIVWNSEVAAIHGDGPARVAHPARHRRPARRASSTATGLFIAIGHDPRSELLERPGRPRRRGLRRWSTHPSTAHQPARRLRLRRPGRPPLPPGDHRRRHRLRRGPRRRALPRRPRPRRPPCRRAPRPSRSPLDPRIRASTEPRRRPGNNRRRHGVHSGDTHRAGGVTRTTRKEPPWPNLRCRHRRRLRGDGAQVRQAGPGRLLGRVVRSVPPGRPDPRRDRRRARRQDHLREDERRREPRRPRVLPRQRHPDASTSTRAARS